MDIGSGITMCWCTPHTEYLWTIDQELLGCDSERFKATKMTLTFQIRNSSIYSYSNFNIYLYTD